MGEMFCRTELLVGKDCMKQIQTQKVIIFGIGGVGSWCAESLVRSGFLAITLVDFDVVNLSNCNRQLQATQKTLGQRKTAALKTRLLDINPDACITECTTMYFPQTSSQFCLQNYDVIIDAIDTIHNKVHLIREATKTQAFFISSMGAARKIDPNLIRVSNFWNVEFCFLARKIRKTIKKGELPARDFLCVYSIEQNKTARESVEDKDGMCQINGSIAHMTAIFGFTIAAKVIQHVVNANNEKI